MLISCTTAEMLEFTEDLVIHVDTLLFAALAGVFIYLSDAYKNPKENISFGNISQIPLKDLSHQTGFFNTNGRYTGFLPKISVKSRLLFHKKLRYNLNHFSFIKSGRFSRVTSCDFSSCHLRILR